MKTSKRTYIRFNTEFPNKGKKWRLLDENFNEFMQVDSFTSKGCSLESSTDTLPSGELKHHVKLEHSDIMITEDVAIFLP